MIIRRIEPEDAGNVSALIVRTLREVNTKDYSREYIENDVQKLQPKDILERAKLTHFYVVCDEDKSIIDYPDGSVVRYNCILNK